MEDFGVSIHATGNVFPNLGTMYAPGTSPTYPTNAAQEITMIERHKSVQRRVTSGYRIIDRAQSRFELWLTEDGHGHLVKSRRECYPIGGRVQPAGRDRESYVRSTGTEHVRTVVYTDQTNFYVPDCFASKVYEYSQTPPFAQSIVGINVYRSRARGSDSKEPTGGSGQRSPTAPPRSKGWAATTSGPATASNSACATAISTFRANGVHHRP